MKVSVKNDPTYVVELDDSELRLVQALLESYSHGHHRDPTLQGFSIGFHEAHAMARKLGSVRP